MARQKDPPIPATDRLFLDTGYVIARFNRRDAYHDAAKSRANVVADASELWTTDAVLLEVAFRARPDKAWSLTDCLSFVTMAEKNLREALTTDGHFTQAGFRAVLLEP
jgi:predicted nucleic acid-binding protein